MKKASAFFCVFFCLCAAVFSSESDAGFIEEAERLVPAGIAEELVQTGKVQRTAYRTGESEFLYYPRTQLGKETLSVWSGDPPAFFVETLYFMKKEHPTAPGADIPLISKELRSLSTLEGIKYYSNTRKKMRTLYEESYVVDGPDSKQRSADPVAGSADGMRVYAVQKDSSLGRCVYQYDFRQTQDEVSFVMQNLDSIYYGPFKVIKPGNLRICLVVYDAGDALFAYALVQAEFPAFSWLENRLTNSFTARADAFYDWFVSGYLDGIAE